METVERFGISMPRQLAEAFDRLIRRKGYTNRSEAIRDLIRDSLVREQWEFGDADAGTPAHTDIWVDEFDAEFAVRKPLGDPPLRHIRPGTPEYPESQRLLAFLEWFLPCSSEHVPDNSLLREFIGGSTLRDFTV